MDIYLVISIIVITLLVILLFHRLYLIYNLVLYKENFSLWTSGKPCEYDPNNTSMVPKNTTDCIEKCLYGSGKVGLYNDCSYSECSNICNECEKLPDTKCPWEKVEPSDITTELKEPKINVKSYDNYIKVSFKRPNDRRVGITGYIYYIKSFDTNKPLRIGTMPDNNCYICETLIKDLEYLSKDNKPQKYSIGLRSYYINKDKNIKKFSPMSNIVTFIPKYTLVEYNYKLDSPIAQKFKNYSFCE